RSAAVDRRPRCRARAVGVARARSTPPDHADLAAPARHGAGVAAADLALEAEREGVGPGREANALAPLRLLEPADEAHLADLTAVELDQDAAGAAMRRRRIVDELLHLDRLRRIAEDEGDRRVADLARARARD